MHNLMLNASVPDVGNWANTVCGFPEFYSNSITYSYMLYIESVTGFAKRDLICAKYKYLEEIFSNAWSFLYTILHESSYTRSFILCTLQQIAI